jgi:hypothetical protein
LAATRRAPAALLVSSKKKEMLTEKGLVRNGVLPTHFPPTTNHQSLPASQRTEAYHHPTCMLPVQNLGNGALPSLARLWMIPSTPTCNPCVELRHVSIPPPVVTLRTQTSTRTSHPTVGMPMRLQIPWRHRGNYFHLSYFWVAYSRTQGLPNGWCT